MPKAAPLPHSWPVSDWPPGVYPGRANSARWLVRSHRDELMACGALVRVGRELVVLGEGFARFLARKIDRVEGFEIAPNAERREAA